MLMPKTIAMGSQHTATKGWETLSIGVSTANFGGCAKGISSSQSGPKPEGTAPAMRRFQVGRTKKTAEKVLRTSTPYLTANGNSFTSYLLVHRGTNRNCQNHELDTLWFAKTLYWRNASPTTPRVMNARASAICSSNRS